MSDKKKAPAPKPVEAPNCGNCRWSHEYTEGAFTCLVPLPPQVAKTGKPPRVQRSYVCGLHKPN